MDEGSTVTDFLPTERERGVTIQSAAISFNWPPSDKEQFAPKSARLANIPTHNINLIDTPGHADFTFEVLRSLRILDGAICILDGVAGVEAQTEKVWAQANNYGIPRIIYVNKLDREGASFEHSIRDIGSKLNFHPAICLIPWWRGGKGEFCGVGDPINLRAIQWSEGDGTQFDILTMEFLRQDDPRFHSEIMRARKALVEVLVENEERMIERFVEVDEDAMKISTQEIVQSLRACVLNPTANLVPVFAGASFRNIGIQPLLDGIVQLLPDPTEVREAEVGVAEANGTLSELTSGSLLAELQRENSKKGVRKRVVPVTALVANLEACALAFKVVHDLQHGTLIYVRVYSGTLRRAATLYNTNLRVSEKAQWLLKMYASQSVHIESIPAGQIGVIPGLKSTRTGDTLVSYKGMDARTGPPFPFNAIQLRPIEVPPAMFAASVEPQSAGEQRSITEALSILTREDPSLQVTEDEESGQTLLNGMGEFHLEIAQDRLVNNFKVNAAMGKVEIAYREAILQEIEAKEYKFDRAQSGKVGRASCLASVEPVDQFDESKIELLHVHSTLDEGNRITVGFLKPRADDTPESEFTLPEYLPVCTIINALKNGALAALGRGVKYGFRMHNTHVTLALDPAQYTSNADVNASAISSVARLATKDSLQRACKGRDPAILEPIMDVTVNVDEASLGAVANDLAASRGGQVLSLEEDFEDEDGEWVASPTMTPHRSQRAIDLSRIYCPPDPFGSESAGKKPKQETGQRTVRARVPLKEMIGYLKYLRSLTAGRGSFVMAPYRFERVVGQREKNLLKELRGGF